MSAVTSIKGRKLPLRNSAGKFTKHEITPSGVPSTKKAMTPTKARFNITEFKRRRLTHSRIGKKTSVVWHFFKALPCENGVSRAVCLLCKVVFKNPGGSTTGMRGHLDRKHQGAVQRVLAGPSRAAQNKGLPRPARTPVFKSENHVSTRVASPPSLSIGNRATRDIRRRQYFEDNLISDNEEHAQIASSSTSRDRRRHNFPGPPPGPEFNLKDDDFEQMTKSIALYMASHMKPLRSLNHPGFLKMMGALNSSYTLDTMDEHGGFSNRVCHKINELYENTKRDIAKCLENKHISICVELWSRSVSEFSVLVTANHVSQEWTFEACFLGLRNLPETTMMTPMGVLCETVSSVLSTLLQEYSIDKSKILNIVFNSGPFKQESETRILSLPTMPCYNTILRHSYYVLNDYASSVVQRNVLETTKKIAKIWLPTYHEVKHQPGRLMQHFQTYVTTATWATAETNVPFPETISPEDMTSYIKMQQPINETVECLLDEPMILVSEIVFLIFGMRQMYTDLVEKNDTGWQTEQVRAIADVIMAHFQNSFKMDLSVIDLSSSMLPVWLFFDPRYKYLPLFTPEQRTFVHETILQMMYQHLDLQRSYPGYPTHRPNSSGFPLNEPSDPLNTSEVNSPNAYRLITSKLDALICLIGTKKPLPPPRDDVEDELKKYVNEVCPVQSYNPLLWWSRNGNEYPILSALARKFLSAQLIATPGRLMFTSAGEKLYTRLANVKADFREKYLCLRYHYSELMAEREAFPESQYNRDCSQVSTEDLNIKSEGDETASLEEED